MADPRNALALPSNGWVNALNDYFAPTAGDTYGNILPLARSGETNALRVAMPMMARDAINSLAFFVDAPRAASSGEIDPMDPATIERLAQGALEMGAGGMAFAKAPAGALRSGAGRTAKELTPAESKAQEVLDLLKSGRGSEVTDDMLAAADDSYLFNNYDLPMDEASRMARAEDMGFDTGAPLYHGTGEDFDSFSISKRGGVADAFSARKANWLTDSPTTAQGYADMASREAPVMRLIKESEAAERRGDWDSAHSIMVQAEALESNMPASAGQAIIPAFSKRPNVQIDADGGGVNDLEWRMRDSISDAEKSNGVGVEFLNFSDHPNYGIDDPALHRGIFNPSNIRSRFARFDPRLNHLANLSASGMDPTIAALIQALQTTQAERK